MLDRLISGAGALADAADRSVRSIVSGPRRGFGTTRPGSALVAAVLVGLAALLVAAGIEATDPSVPVHLAAHDVAVGRALPDRTYATISGALDTIYVETYVDANGNDTEDSSESGVAWFYWLVDPTDRTGVTIRSTRPPAEVLTWQGRGIARTDPGYLTEDYPAFQDEVDHSGITVAPDTLIDASAGAAGPVTTVDPGGPIPTTGRPVSLSGSRLSEYLGVCPVDTNHDGECDELEQKAFEIIVYDRATKRGVPVLVRDRPEFVDATMTGLLRREERTVDDAKSVEGFDFGSLDLQVSDRYVLDEPAGAGAAPLAFVLAAALAAVALVIVIGLAGGYLVYRRSAAALPAAQTTLAAGERIPLRITGVVQTPTGRLHVREVPGGLVRFALGREVAPDGARDARGSARGRRTRCAREPGRRRLVRLARTSRCRRSAGRTVVDPAGHAASHDRRRRADRLSARCRARSRSAGGAVDR